ncbi:MAG: inorganic diphosphatase, partial [Gallionellaceae bacterium]
IPHTLSDDGDPVDVLVVTPIPLQTGVVVRCRPLAVLKMEDEAGFDAKVLAVPVDKLTTVYRGLKSYTELPEVLLKQIEHFFAHYKDLEPNKWVKIEGWADIEAARKEILDGVANYQKADVKPEF